MEEIFLWCAVIAGTLMVGQFLLSLIGLGSGALDLDTDADLDSPDDLDTPDDFDHAGLKFTGMLSFRAIVTATAIFGLVGLSSLKRFGKGISLLLALSAAAAVLYAVAWIMQALQRLQHSGTVQLHHTLGAGGTVYIPVPQARTGRGKVTLRVHNRTAEYPAMTDGERLLTGTPVIVTETIDPDTVVVIPFSEELAEQPDAAQ